METNRRKTTGYRQNSYVYGTAARKLEPAADYELPERYALPEEQPVREEREQEQVKRQPFREAGRVPAINLLSLIFLLGVIGITLWTCMSYLKAQADVTQMEKKIKTLESTLTSTTNKNDAMLASISEALDLDHIYSVAVNELGMVYPNKNTVITYATPESGYVRQYEEIPEAEEESILDRFSK